jgi:hypothetical protein
VHAVLARTSAFILFGSALWALRPLVVRTEMKLGPSAYGQLLSALGAGALIGAAMLRKLKAIASVDGLITSASAVFATVTIGSGLLRNYKGFWNAKASALLRSSDSQRPLGPGTPAWVGASVRKS